jgi:hydrogenase maturation protein HypF
MKAARIVIRGQVQGLGFRPFVYRLARQLELKGTVANTRNGVEIHVQGDKVRAFIAAVKSAPPRLARIASIRASQIKCEDFSEFSIVKENRDATVFAAKTGGVPIFGVDVLPDIATCSECEADINDVKNRRYGYPFTNCTQCGPRYSIIISLPYDRPRTTMRRFKMCRSCQQEYDAPANRRFHAQPNCCPACGPSVRLLHANGNLFDEANPIETAIRLLLDGRILAIKNMGGYQLACDACNEGAVAELRRRKDRLEKPLAILCPDLTTVRKFCRVDPVSRELLEDLARPVVLLPKASRPGLAIAPSVAPGINYWGVMLPCTPLHHLLFRSTTQSESEPASLQALVMTSANPRDEPILAALPELVARMGSVLDYILDHDRDIANRCDDSVVGTLPVFAPKTGGVPIPPILVRRSRGYAPSPVVLDPRSYRLKPVLACGAELKNTFAFTAGNRVYLSPHIGDLESAAGMEFFEGALSLYRKIYDLKPEAIACDLHPDYMSTRFAENLALKSHRPLIRVQHHHAHVASVIAEHNLKEPVLGIALDGTGLGTDERIWGCELLLVWRHRFERLAHLRYLPLVGGEAIITEPLKIAASYLVYLIGEQAFALLPGLEQYRTLFSQLILGTNVVFTSSTGRLFDAVSAMLGLCTKASYEGQAPSVLESAANSRETGSYFQESNVARLTKGPWVIDPKPWLEAIIRDWAARQTPGRISRRFHNTVTAALAHTCRLAVREHRIRTVCLSGGSFQNRLLLRELTQTLSRARLSVYTNRAVPVNDGGISLGQAIVADAQLRKSNRNR